jgi:hypothetical protein
MKYFVVVNRAGQEVESGTTHERLQTAMRLRDDSIARGIDAAIVEIEAAKIHTGRKQSQNAQLEMDAAIHDAWLSQCCVWGNPISGYSVPTPTAEHLAYLNDPRNAERIAATKARLDMFVRALTPENRPKTANA